MSDIEIRKLKNKIDGMSHYQMGVAWRFHELGDSMFDCSTDVPDYFEERFNRLGGWTTELSKRVGWE